MLTGRHPNRLGCWHTLQGRSLLQLGEPTLANRFQDAGWATGLVGKWHLGDYPGYLPMDRGFQEATWFPGGGVGQANDYWGNDYMDDVYLVNGTPSRFSGFCSTVWTDQAIAFATRHRTEPFFLYLAYNAPHAPFRAPPGYAEPFLAAGLPADHAGFYGMIAHLDGELGRFDKALSALGLRDNTMLVFVSDNGSACGWHAGLRERKGSPYDGGHRVPCFVRWPAGGVAGPRRVGRLAAHVDLAPTLLDACSIASAHGPPADGMSLLPTLIGGDQPGLDQRILVVDNQRIDRPLPWHETVVMRGPWRLVHRAELYRIDTDPGQRQDLYEAHPEIVEDLRNGYEAWWKAIQSDMGRDARIPVGTGSDVQWH